MPCATFRYPNDQPLRESADLLAHELRLVADHVQGIADHAGGPTPWVDLSPRAVLEDPQLDVANVDQLIMLAPPNHGSELAHLACSLDVVEYLRSEVTNVGRNHPSSSARFWTGCPKRRTTCKPKSEFLTRLNRSPRNDRVCYTIVLGLASCHRQIEADPRPRRLLERAGAKCSWAEYVNLKTKGKSKYVAEMIDGRGDGFVAVKRGRLTGVNDVFDWTFLA